jgi:hypothetical protein
MLKCRPICVPSRIVDFDVAPIKTKSTSGLELIGTKEEALVAVWVIVVRG